jgi:response regulator NasT
LLVVDDDRVILATLEDGLHDAGYEVAVAGSAKEAIDLIIASPPDLAIIDVRMPGMDGIALAGHLREHTNVPFVFLSAYGDLPLVRSAVAQGALGYLLKPIDIHQLVPSIEASLERGRELTRLRESENRLKTALSIEQKTRTAVGLLMERRRLDQQSAFEVLRMYARSQRRKIGDVAQDVISAAEGLNAPGSPPAKDS